MTNSPIGRNPVEQLAEEFLGRYRRGERPSFTEYTQKHPELAGEIRDLFPALVLMEEAGSPEAKPAGPCSGTITADGQALEQVGDFRIIREVGRGGMGVVYEAEQVSLGRHVALKVLPHVWAADSQRLQRFCREARSAARLHHSNIVPVFEVGEYRGVHYYAMQFIQGQGLDEVMRELGRMRGLKEPPAATSTDPIGPDRPPDLRLAPSLASGLMTGQFPAEGRLAANDDTKKQTVAAAAAGLPPPPCPSSAMLPRSAADPGPSAFAAAGSWSELSTPSDFHYYRGVARLGLQVAEALSYAHGQKILHRDIKPANLLLDLQGTVWVTDFGLAKEEGEDLTRTGEVVGTLRYLAPERFSGASEPRSDIYSLGLTLYELLTFRPAFDEVDQARLIQQVMRQEPPRPRQLDRRVPRDLETIVLKATAKEPKRRYQTAAELAEDLRRFLADRPIQARRTRLAEHVWRWCRRNPALAIVSSLAVAALLLAAGVLVLFSIHQYQTAAELDRALQDTRLHRRQADRSAATLALDRAQGLGEQGDAQRAMQWLARGLEMAQRGESPALARALRTNLASWQGRFHPLRAYLVHRDWIQAVSFSPDGQLAVTGSDDHTARIWIAATGEPATPPLRHPAAVRFVAFSPDGKLLLTLAGRDAFLWQVANGRLCRPPLRHPAAVTAAALGPNGTALVTAAADGKARIWTTASGRLAATLHGHRAALRAVAFQGRLILTAGDDHTAHLWQASTGKRVFASGLRHRQPVRAVAFSPDGKTLATGSDDDTACLWDAATGQRIGPPLAHEDSVDVLVFSPDGSRLATGSGDWKVRFWDAATGRPLGPPLQHQAPVSGVAFSPDGRTLLSASRDGKARVWATAGGRLVHAPLMHQGEVRAVAFSPDGQTALTAGHESAARLWTIVPNRQERRSIPRHGWPYVMAFSPDRRTLAGGGEPSSAWLARVTTGAPAGVLAHQKSVRAVAFSPDGKLLVTGSWDGTVRLWDVASARQVGGWPHPGKVNALAISPDGQTLVTGTLGGTIRLWAVKRGKLLGQERAHTSPVSALAFSPDGKTFVTGSADLTAQLWDTATRKRRGPALRHQGQVWSAAFRPDGPQVLTGSTDKTARLWDTATGQALGAPLYEPGDRRPGAGGQTAGASLPERAGVRTVAWSPDGNTLLVGTWGGTCRLWDEATRHPLGVPLQHDGAVLAAAFTGDGRQVCTAGEDYTVRFWDVPKPLAGKVQRITLWVQVITGMELDAEGGAHVLEPRVWQQRHRQLEELGGPPVPGEGARPVPR